MLAARRGLAVVVLALVSWRGDRQSSNEAEREDDVGRRSAVRPGRRTRRTTTRSAHVDEVDGGAIKERRARCEFLQCTVPSQHGAVSDDATLSGRDVILFFS